MPLHEDHLGFLRRFFDDQTPQHPRLQFIDARYPLYWLRVVDLHLVPLNLVDLRQRFFGDNMHRQARAELHLNAHVFHHYEVGEGGQNLE